MHCRHWGVYYFTTAKTPALAAIPMHTLQCFLSAIQQDTTTGHSSDSSPCCSTPEKRLDHFGVQLQGLAGIGLCSFCLPQLQAHQGSIAVGRCHRPILLHCFCIALQRLRESQTLMHAAWRAPSVSRNDDRLRKLPGQYPVQPASPHPTLCHLFLLQCQGYQSTHAEAALALFCVPTWGSADRGLAQGASDSCLLQVSLLEGCIAALSCSFGRRQLSELGWRALLGLLHGSLQTTQSSQWPCIY